MHESSTAHLFNYGAMNTLKQDLGILFPGNMTVGAAFVCCCVVSGIKPELFGFDITDNVDRTHYWEKRPPKADYVSHNIKAELELLKVLDNKGLIKINI